MKHAKNRQNPAPTKRAASRCSATPGATVSLRAAARRWGANPGTVARWRDAGLVVVDADGRVDVEASDALLRSGGKLGAPAVAHSHDDPALNDLARRLGDGEMLSLGDAEQVKQNALARLRQLQYDREAGRVVAVEDVARAVTAEYSLVRNRLLAIPAKAAPRCVAASGLAEVRDILDAEVREALEHLTQDGGDG